jgi:hypothetical protein
MDKSTRPLRDALSKGEGTVQRKKRGENFMKDVGGGRMD